MHLFSHDSLHFELVHSSSFILAEPPAHAVTCAFTSDHSSCIDSVKYNDCVVQATSNFVVRHLPLLASMRLLEFAVSLLAAITVASASAPVDCWDPSGKQGVLSLNKPLNELDGWHDGMSAVLEGHVKAVPGSVGKRMFFVQVTTSHVSSLTQPF